LSEALRSGFQILKVLMAGLVVLFLCSGFFIVPPNQVVVLLRFGKPVGTGPDQLLKKGLHWAFPYPIDEKVHIQVGQIHTVTSTAGWYAVSPEDEARNIEPAPRGRLFPDADGYTLTADGNIIHVRATIKYLITDPLRYQFDFTNAVEILTNVVNEALFYVSARVTADAALYKNKTGFRDLVVERVKQKVEELQLGIALEPSDVETKAPIDVRAAFEAVNAAEQDRSRAISDARGKYDQLTRTAVGEANAILSAGLASSNRMVVRVAADARAFNLQLPRYTDDPQLFARRLLTATMERVLTNAQEKFFLADHPGGQPRELRIQISREPQKKEGPERP
jgi:membrane protease subunit HflK